MCQTGSWHQTRRKPSGSQKWENRSWGNTPSWKSLLRNHMSLRWGKSDPHTGETHPVYARWIQHMKYMQSNRKLMTFTRQLPHAWKNSFMLDFFSDIHTLYPFSNKYTKKERKKHSICLYLMCFCMHLSLLTWNWVPLPSCGEDFVCCFSSLYERTLKITRGWFWFCFGVESYRALWTSWSRKPTWPWW